MSSRDRILVSVLMMAWLGPSPGRRRLRFSFQINDFKDRLAFAKPAGAPGGREEGRL
jgi:hypothetical protein